MVVDARRRVLQCASAGCGYRTDRLPTPEAVRDAAVTHLGQHAQRERLAAHLRSCNCRTAGCAWHVGSRSCTGQIVLVLFRSPGGRSWHLADACETCAGAIPHAARVPMRGPVTVATPEPVRRRPRGGEARSVAEQQAAARAALAYTAASLPPGVSGEARLLAVVCALRVRPTGLAPLPLGITRTLRLRAPAGALAELQEARWLHYLGRPCGGPAAFVPELAGTPGRKRAGQWALQLLADRRTIVLPAPTRLAALAVSAAEDRHGEAFLLDPEGTARSCGLDEKAFEDALADVSTAGVLADWYPLPSGLLLCSLARAGPRRGGG
ncbi:hypothetical protein ACGFX4_37275 [Kitasatospora sp. NPDC048365]|uniref:hypothetical protein n=1 Tax=Kitasatospora sp. NPDC048365 TaxID=3364050 RepID=UPI003711215E